MTGKKPQFLEEKRLKWKRKNKKMLSRIYRVDDSVMTLFPNFFHQHILLSSHFIIKRFSTIFSWINPSNLPQESDKLAVTRRSLKKKNLVTYQIWLNWQHWMAATDLSGHLQLPTTIDYPPSTIRGSSVAAFRLRFQSHSRTSPPDSRWAIVARLWPFWPRALGPNCTALNSINASNPHALHRPRVLRRKK